MRALVTGGTGFIGRRLVSRLLDRFGREAVTILVRPALTPLEADALATYGALGLRLIDGDLLQDPVSRDAPPAVDVVFHLAANIDTDASENQLRVNDLGTQRFLEWLAPVSRGVRIVYASSVAVHDRDREPNGPISERSPFAPRTAYGRTKLRGEAVLQQHADRDGYTWTILRLPTVYGPGQKPDGLFDQLIRRASRNEWLGRINWPGRTSVIYVDDVADVMIEFAAMSEAGGEVYCLASDDNVTVGQLAQKAAAVLEQPINPIEIPQPVLAATQSLVWNSAVQAAVPRFAWLPFWRLSLVVSDGFWFDTTKFRAAYRKPLRTVDQGLRETIAAEPPAVS